jgi:hypothetical protein
MKTITLYQAVDGSNWPTEAEALKRDTLCAQVNEAMSAVRARPKVLDAGNGDFFLQQDRDKVLSAKQAIVEVTGHDVFKHPAADIHPQSFAGRLLDDMGGPLRDAWWRLSCIDLQWREWDQPYYVNNPEENATAL